MISAIVITKNEEKMIAGCLESLKWADEIIVFDDSSADKTIEIAKQYTNLVFSEKVKNFSDHRNRAVEKSKGNWILFVDADERVTKELKDEILELTRDSKFSAYAISRRNFIFGQEVRYSAFWPDWVTRLIRKKDFEGYVGDVHEYPKIRGETGYTKASLIHFTHRNVDQIVQKSLNWSRIDAKLRLDAGHPSMSGWRFLRILISETYEQGIKRRGFFSGTVGTMDALLQVFSMLITYIRLWEMQQLKTLEETYQDIDKKLLSNDFSVK